MSTLNRVTVEFLVTRELDSLDVVQDVLGRMLDHPKFISVRVVKIERCDPKKVDGDKT